MSDSKQSGEAPKPSKEGPFDRFDSYTVEVLVDRESSELGLGIAFMKKDDVLPSEENSVVVPLNLKQASELALVLIKAVSQLSQAEESLRALPLVEGKPN